MSGGWEAAVLTDEEPEVILRVESLHKAYGRHSVLRGVDLEVARGEVVGLMGANGAGKSTLASVLSGALNADAGTVELDGQLVDSAEFAEARAAGIGIIEQRYELDPNLHVAEAILRHRAQPWASASEMRRAAQAILIDIGVAIDPDVLLADLDRGALSLVETARLMADRRDLVILDEVDADLNPRELDELRYALGRFSSSGHGVIYITHRPEEALATCHKIAVLRDGVIAEVKESSTTSAAELTEAIFATPVETAYRRPGSHVRESVAVGIRGLPCPGQPGTLELDLRRGEVLGIVAQRADPVDFLVEALTGDVPSATARIEINGEPVSILHPREAVAARISHFPADEGRVSPGTALARALMAGQVTDEDEFDSELAQLEAALDVLRQVSEKGRRWFETSESLSGGQEAMKRLRQVLSDGTGVAILQEPARSLDLVARSDLAALVSAFTAQGGSVLLVSADPRVLLGLSDRLVGWAAGAFRADWHTQQVHEEDITAVLNGDPEFAQRPPLDVTAVRP